jgi:hypothetical protein
MLMARALMVAVAVLCLSDGARAVAQPTPPPEPAPAPAPAPEPIPGPEPVPAPEAAPTSVPEPSPAPSEPAPAATAEAAPAAEPEPPSFPTLHPYGFVRLDFIAGDSRLSNIQFPFFAESEPDDRSAETSIHPRLSRVGLDLMPFNVTESAQVAGKIEIDFQNGGRESREVPRLRHGYLTLGTPMFELLAGQTWDLIAPLFPTANADSLMWNAGNLGDRRPQIRATAKPPAGDGSLRLAVAVGQTGAVDGQDRDMDMRIDGQDGLPTAQALAELKIATVTAGVWGHVARETVDATNTDSNSMAVGAHGKVEIGKAAVQGEVWYGQELSDVRGAIGQAVNGMGEEIAAAGGWLEVAVKPIPQSTTAVGFTIDDPVDDDIDVGQRSRNYVAYLAQHIRPWKAFQVGAEYLFWTTDYKEAEQGRVNRIDVHLTAFFE